MSGDGTLTFHSGPGDGKTLAGLFARARPEFLMSWCLSRPGETVTFGVCRVNSAVANWICEKPAVTRLHMGSGAKRKCFAFSGTWKIKEPGVKACEASSCLECNPHRGHRPGPPHPWPLATVQGWEELPFQSLDGQLVQLYELQLMLHNVLCCQRSLNWRPQQKPRKIGGGKRTQSSVLTQVSVASSCGARINMFFWKFARVRLFKARQPERHFNQELQPLIGSCLLPSFLLPAPGATKVITARPLVRPGDSCAHTLLEYHCPKQAHAPRHLDRRRATAWANYNLITNLI